MQDTTRDAILEALAVFIRQRPGIDPRNYISDWRDTEGRRLYRAEVREITRDLHDARALLAAVEMSNVTGEELASRLSPNGRLSWNGERISYCTGQYFPTEYRSAVARTCASALWYAWADEYHARHGTSEGTRDYVQKRARSYFGRGIAKRWFA
jgi:hypothetical protein